MSRIRGGANSTQIRVAARRIGAFIDRVDILVALDAGAVGHCARRVDGSTLVVGDRSTIGDVPGLVDLPFAAICAELGDRLATNFLAVGALAGILAIEATALESYVRGHFAGKKPELAERSVRAVRRGREEGRRIVAETGMAVDIGRGRGFASDWLTNGSEAVGLGALAGGCDFISSYPMSPGTGVLQFLASHKNEFGLVVDQSEDEIAAANMALGAWYTGARALVTTSGGGFALMSETVSLAGMIETPLVVHIGQRPGPATGLPTRTEQGDLDLVLHAGHGEFPRAIFAPGSAEEAFALTRRAFEVADRFQVPAFILTDQFLLDSNWGSEPFAISAEGPERRIVATDGDYLRYAPAADGISPRGVPGWGEGVVRVDSDEHDEEGLITEDAIVRVRMVDKRLAKAAALAEAALPPTIFATGSWDTIVVCWGSTKGVVLEAAGRSGLAGLAVMHVPQPWPLHPSVGELLGRARRIVVVENNATGQFARLLRAETGYRSESVLKYDGSAFSVEELARGLAASAATSLGERMAS